jgi:hypothetical protein
MSQVGRRLDIMSSLVPTMLPSRRLTRYAPVRMFCIWVFEMPDRLLRMLPASLSVSFLNRGGGAKSRFVKVPDFRNACLKIR